MRVTLKGILLVLGVAVGDDPLPASSGADHLLFLLTPARPLDKWPFVAAVTSCPARSPVSSGSDGGDTLPAEIAGGQGSTVASNGPPLSMDEPDGSLSPVPLWLKDGWETMDGADGLVEGDGELG